MFLQHNPTPFQKWSTLVYLEDDRLVVLLEVERKDVGEHERGAALAQHIHGLLQELHLDPWHVVLLHLLHLLFNLGVQLVLEAQALHVVHVAVAVEQVPLQSRSGTLRSTYKLVLSKVPINTLHQALHWSLKPITDVSVERVNTMTNQRGLIIRSTALKS